MSDKFSGKSKYVSIPSTCTIYMYVRISINYQYAYAFPYIWHYNQCSIKFSYCSAPLFALSGIFKAICCSKNGTSTPFITVAQDLNWKNEINKTTFDNEIVKEDINGNTFFN